MDNLGAVIERLRNDGWRIAEAESPAYDGDAAVKCLDACRRNLCGSYGTTWACPPGWTERMDVLESRYGATLIVSRRFEADATDANAVSSAEAELRGAIRALISAMRSSGIPCMGMADGACDICGKCSYPGPCMHPDELVPSVSATGIDMGTWLESIGEPFVFERNAFTLYGIVLYRPGTASSRNGYESHATIHAR